MATLQTDLTYCGVFNPGTFDVVYRRECVEYEQGRIDQFDIRGKLSPAGSNANHVEFATGGVETLKSTVPRRSVDLLALELLHE